MGELRVCADSRQGLSVEIPIRPSDQVTREGNEVEESYPFFWSQEFQGTTELGQIAKTASPFDRPHTAGFSVQGDMLHIPYQATFGGWIDERGAPSDPDTSVEATTQLLRITGVSSCRITFPPAYFCDGGFEPQRASLAAYASEEIIETNHHINIDPLSSELDFSRGNRKRIRALAETGAYAAEVEPSRITMAYQLLHENRQRRGVKLSMTESKFVNCLKRIPHKFELFEIRNGDEMLAAAYVVDIHKDVSYVLYWGDSVEGRRASAVASMAQHLTSLSRKRGKKILDLGISSVEGQLDEGLSRFKVNLGAKTSPKSTLLIPAKNLLKKNKGKVVVTIV
jgi:hypothetical protein